jgi:hypothetical protein
MKWCPSEVSFEARNALHTKLHSRKRPKQLRKFNSSSLLNVGSRHLLSVYYLTTLRRCITDLSRNSERSVTEDGTTVVPLTCVNTNNSKPARFIKDPTSTNGRRGRH